MDKKKIQASSSLKRWMQLFRCYQLRSVSGVLQAPSIEMEAEYTVLQVQPSDKVIDLFGDNPWAAGYQYLSVL